MGAAGGVALQAESTTMKAAAMMKIAALFTV